MRKIAIYFTAALMSAVLSSCSSVFSADDAKIVGEYFLGELKGGRIDNDVFIHSQRNLNDLEITDENVLKIMDSGIFNWASFYDDSTILIYEGAFSQVCCGYLVTDGKQHDEGDFNIGWNAFDGEKITLSKTKYDSVYYFQAGL